MLILIFTVCLDIKVYHGFASENSFTGPPKSKTFYFHNFTKTILGQDRYIMNTLLPRGENPMEIVFYDAEKSFSWFIDPPLAGDLWLNGTVSLNIWMKLISGAGEGTLFVTFRLGLYEIFENGTRTCIINEGEAINQVTLGPITSHFSEYSAKGYIQTMYRVSAGSRLEVVLDISSNDRAKKHVIWGSSDFRSRVSLPALNHIDVNSIDAFNAKGEQPSYFETNDTITFKATIVDPFGGYDIRWVNFTLEAPDGSLLFQKASMRLIDGNDTSFSCIYELVWETIPKMRGTYYVTVEAVDNTGYYYRFPDRPDDETFGGHLESETITLSIGKVICAVFMIQDSLAQPLAKAILELWDGTNLIAQVYTNQSGWTEIPNVPSEGNYTAIVWWQGVKVFDGQIYINETNTEKNPIILETAVYYPTFKIVDYANIPLGDANVFISYPNGTMSILPLKTDIHGQFNLSQVAGGTYTLRIIWSGVEVGLKYVNVSSNEIYVVKADVFYLTVKTVDPKGYSVESVHVIVYDVSRALVVDSKLSNASGITVFRLPKATYNLRAVWLGANVGFAEAIKLDQNLTIVIPLKIFDVIIKVVDQRQIPLEQSTIEVSYEGFNVVGTSNQNGEVAFTLPEGTLSLSVWWEGTLVFNGNFTINGNRTEVTVTTQVYYITLKAIDRNGNPIVGVYLTLQKDGVAMGGGFTNQEGTCEFRLPVGNYTIIAKLKTTFFLTSVNFVEIEKFQTPSDTIVTVQFLEFPPPFTSTVLFYIILTLFIGFTALILIITIMRKHMSR